MADAILIGYDGSPAAERAIRAARGLVSASRAVIATVWEPALPATPLTMADGFPGINDLDPETAARIDEAAEQRGKRIADHGAAVARDAGFDAEAVIVPDERDVAEALAELAGARGFAAIVVGAKGHSALHDRLLGSTSSSLLHRARCPVLVVPAPEGD